MNFVSEHVTGLVIDSEPTTAELAGQLLGDSDGPRVQLEYAATLEEDLKHLTENKCQLVMLNANVLEAVACKRS